LVKEENAKAKKPVFAAKYQSLSQTCDKRIIPDKSRNLKYDYWR
jgi:hypothetical protein